MGAEKWLRVGRMPTGPLNKISDVPGILVGHCTLANGEDQTGVTAILPHGGDWFHDKVMASSVVLNGFGKSAGLIQIEELGTIETPILLTNTLSVGAAVQALTRVMLEKNADICCESGSVNAVVCECNDQTLNDIRAQKIGEEHVRAALADCRADFEEGAVGAGRGMRCFSLKGGIGSASRVFELDGQTYTLGVLTLTNHGTLDDLIVLGEPVGEKIRAKLPKHEDKGSVITILATDAPLSERQLKRIAKRSLVGLSRTGSMCGNGSGEITIAFTTANRVPHNADGAFVGTKMLHDDLINTLFRATAEAVEESVLSSLYHAETVTGRNGTTVYGLCDLLEEE